MLWRGGSHRFPSPGEHRGLLGWNWRGGNATTIPCPPRVGCVGIGARGCAVWWDEGGDLLDQRVDLAAPQDQVSSLIRSGGWSPAGWEPRRWAVALVKARPVFDGEGETRGRL